MTVDQLIAFYEAKNKSSLARKINVCRSTITGWEQKGIPLRNQTYFEVLTQGQLKADRGSLSATNH